MPLELQTQRVPIQRVLIPYFERNSSRIMKEIWSMIPTSLDLFRIEDQLP